MLTDIQLAFYLAFRSFVRCSYFLGRFSPFFSQPVCYGFCRWKTHEEASILAKRPIYTAPDNQDMDFLKLQREKQRREIQLLELNAKAKGPSFFISRQFQTRINSFAGHCSFRKQCWYHACIMQLDMKLSILDSSVVSGDSHCIDNANFCNFILSQRVFFVFHTNFSSALRHLQARPTDNKIAIIFQFFAVSPKHQSI